jgi:hypothetical protein
MTPADVLAEDAAAALAAIGRPGASTAVAQALIGIGYALLALRYDIAGAAAAAPPPAGYGSTR